VSDSSFAFEIEATDGAARRGVMRTAHGVVQTPAFMPVGTQGAVKAILHRDLEALGADIILGNTYHLFLRPGDDLIARRGGLHRFIGWTRPILTDSGGYQVFSLAARRRLDEAGVTFHSHLDGTAHLLSPERVVDIQAQLGSDIAMVLDECIANPGDEGEARRAVERTRRWAARARARFEAVRHGAEGVMVTNPGQAQFGIVQGSVYPRLRVESARATVDLGFEAYAIGGLSVGEPPPIMYEMVEHTAPELPARQPRYLMGVGTPVDLVEAVARGVDLFDCVLPTRNARNGQLLTRQGPINIKNARWAEDDRPVDEACGCYTCRHASRAYLRHLFMAGEISGATLNTLHNLAFYLDTMSQMREAIVFRRFESFRAAFLDAYGARRSEQ
jgi:queuine tRNA-ribosyltransferase